MEQRQEELEADIEQKKSFHHTAAEWETCSATGEKCHISIYFSDRYGLLMRTFIKYKCQSQDTFIFK